MIGLYIHVPFCASKCPYCDFYSMRGTTAARASYTEAAARTIAAFGNRYRRRADTVYIGGGTPSVLDGAQLTSLLDAARRSFRMDGGAEVTVECNPSSDLETVLPALAAAGVNRISLGLQSAVDTERRRLGRSAGAERVKECIALARACGIPELSLDIMLGVPGQTPDSLQTTLDFCIASGVQHISAYMLTLEEGTVFYRRRSTLELPDEETVCRFYEMTCQTLEQAGLRQYEISNFAVPGHESRHNLKYWRCREYLGVGPGAHSYIDGQRFFYPRSLDGFMAGQEPVPDGPGGGLKERMMLALRLTDGFHEPLPETVRAKAEQPWMRPYVVLDDRGIRLTREGFLVSNTVIAELLPDDDETR